MAKQQASGPDSDDELFPAVPEPRDGLTMKRASVLALAHSAQGEVVLELPGGLERSQASGRASGRAWGRVGQRRPPGRAQDGTSGLLRPSGRRLPASFQSRGLPPADPWSHSPVDVAAAPATPGSQSDTSSFKEPGARVSGARPLPRGSRLAWEDPSSVSAPTGPGKQASVVEDTATSTYSPAARDRLGALPTRSRTSGYSRGRQAAKPTSLAALQEDKPYPPAHAEVTFEIRPTTVKLGRKTLCYNASRPLDTIVSDWVGPATATSQAAPPARLLLVSALGYAHRAAVRCGLQRQLTRRMLVCPNLPLHSTSRSPTPCLPPWRAPCCTTCSIPSTWAASALWCVLEALVRPSVCAVATPCLLGSPPPHGHKPTNDPPLFPRRAPPFQVGGSLRPGCALLSLDCMRLPPEDAQLAHMLLPNADEADPDLHAQPAGWFDLLSANGDDAEQGAGGRAAAREAALARLGASLGAWLEVAGLEVQAGRTVTLQVRVRAERLLCSSQWAGSLSSKAAPRVAAHNGKASR
jgi:hypothetical protein